MTRVFIFTVIEWTDALHLESGDDAWGKIVCTNAFSTKEKAEHYAIDWFATRFWDEDIYGNGVSNEEIERLASLQDVDNLIRKYLKGDYIPTTVSWKIIENIVDQLEH